MNNMFPISNTNHPEMNFNLGNSQKKDQIEEPSFEELVEKAIEYSKDHTGSRLIQKKYEECSNEERDKLFNKIQPEILGLSKDVFGNYAIQKILETKDDKKNKIIFI